MTTLGRYQTKLLPTSARLLRADHAPFPARPARNPAQRQGQLYETWARGRLEQAFGPAFLPGPWFHYTTPNGQGYAQPDGLVFDLSAGRIYIIEIKSAHTRLAAHQLFHAYLPLLTCALGPQRRGLFDLIPIEITKHCDPAEAIITYPEVRKVRDFQEAQPFKLNLLIWRKEGWW